MTPSEREVADVLWYSRNGGGSPRGSKSAELRNFFKKSHLEKALTDKKLSIPRPCVIGEERVGALRLESKNNTKISIVFSAEKAQIAYTDTNVSW